MRDKNVNKLIDRYLKDQSEPGEKEQLEDWLDNLANVDKTNNWPQSEQIETQNRIYNKIADRIAGDNIQKKTSVKIKPFLRIASCFAFVILVTLIFRVQLKEFFNIPQYASIRNVKGSVTKSILSDGSIIWLKGDSRLNYPIKFSGSLRKVDLDGEALFEVAKDADHPFIVRCGTLTTCALGTSFNIKHQTNKTEINVLTGKVVLSTKNESPIVIHPHQKATYLELKKTIVKEVQPATELAAITKGTEYNMYFNDARLEDVLYRIKKKFEVDITVKSAKLNDNLITADFTDQSLENTMNIIGETLNLDFNIDGQSVSLKNKTQTEQSMLTK